MTPAFGGALLFLLLAAASLMHDDIDAALICAILGATFALVHAFE